ncbi:CdaR family transcriptional regulator [Citrobacter tructae]|uniref:CdaR family transcriptional regulator n=1 Tax=Citrobacter tructae TaxID=2562449 RepID=UPI003F565E5B
MLISPELANTIVKRAMDIIHHNVNVIDHQGIIIASGENHRIGERHEVACEVIKNRQRMTIETPQQAAKYQNVQPGINHPIIVDDRVALVIGISGNPVAIGRYAELAILTAELLVKQLLEIREINWQYRIRDLLIKQFIEQDDARRKKDILLQLKQQNISLDAAYIPILINIETGGNLLGKTIDHILNEISKILQSQNVILLSHNEILLLVSEPKRADLIVDKINAFLETQLSHYTIAIGVESNEPEAFRRAVFMLKEMQSQAKSLCSDQRIVNGKQLAFDGLLNEAKSSHFTLYYQHQLNKILTSNSGKTLFKTLSTYINNNAEVNATSQNLGIHRNTLNYRLHQIKEITALDPFMFKDLCQLTIALHYYQDRE